MSQILTQIMDVQREQVKKAKREVSLFDFRSFKGFEKPRLSLTEALRGHEQLSIIAEFKRASPSRGDIRADADVKEITDQYIQNGAAALSILTNYPFFKGHNQDIEKISSGCPIPILRKEFILDSWQITESKAIGADAILLIMAALEFSQVDELLHAAAEEGVEVLLECDHPSHLELLHVLGNRVSVVGVNNRDLNTFGMNQASGLELLTHVPDTYVRVSESGHDSIEDLKKVKEAGVDAVLVGTSLMQSEKPGNKLHNLLEVNT